ncbi:MAG: amidohydrolase [Acidobacteria bacterium]|nr:amidohydrolase [Acidobacteriota bacterium]MSO62440.1 amidohydrolase [Acidobacteriota bacterium]
MTAYRAAWVCPIDRPPIRDGVVIVDAGRITGIGDQGSGIGDHGIRDLGNVVLMPGLINAHIHLELSWLRGRVPPAARFTDWVKRLVAARGGVERADDPGVLAPLRAAIRELQASGTVAVGDISNSLASPDPMHAAGLDGVVFHELLGFNERDGAVIERTRAARAAARGRVSLAPHAPYSTSAELFRAIRASVDASACRITSVHLGESPEETELLATGTGPWRGMLELIGVWRDDWAIPGRGPVEYLDGLGVLDGQTLVVHGVQFDDAALARLVALGVTLVTCPRSNQWVGVGVPPLARFYRSGVAVAVGTDSLASVEDLNLFSELKAMRRIAPGVPAAKLLESATLIGARALGLDSELGSLTPGKRAEILAIELPRPVDDIEEYLVSGIDPAQIRHLNNALQHPGI